MFVDSLSGNAKHGTMNASIKNEEDDIAEFLGEVPKKKKNRSGQIARRQRALQQVSFRHYGPNDGDRICRTDALHEKAALQRFGAERQKARSESFRRKNFTKEQNSNVARQHKRLQPQKSECTSRSFHPSWDAKRALKEKEKVVFGAVKAKKIRFTDE